MSDADTAAAQGEVFDLLDQVKKLEVELEKLKKYNLELAHKNAKAEIEIEEMRRMLRAKNKRIAAYVVKGNRRIAEIEKLKKENKRLKELYAEDAFQG